MDSTVHIGTSGWHYRHWRGTFYPQDLPQKRWFDFYRDHFSTVELNTTFYHLPKPQSVHEWHGAAAPGFRYAVKLSRYASHVKRLKNPDETLAPFLERVEALKAHLGPILVQLPPRWAPNPARLDAFLARAPRRHRWAVEFRDRRWLVDEILAILENHGAALCIHDMIDDHPWCSTTDWSYWRFHGDHYRGRYGADRLRPYAEAMAKQRQQGQEVWAYFNNDEAAYATADAQTLRGLCEEV